MSNLTSEFDIIEHPNIFAWIQDLAKKNPLAFVSICGGNVDSFKKLWGDPDGQTQRFDYWKRDYLGITIYVYSEKSTTFYKVQYLGSKEVFLQDKRSGAFISSFLSKLVEDLVN